MALQATMSARFSKTAMAITGLEPLPVYSVCIRVSSPATLAWTTPQEGEARRSRSSNKRMVPFGLGLSKGESCNGSLDIGKSSAKPRAYRRDKCEASLNMEPLRRLQFPTTASLNGAAADSGKCHRFLTDT